MSPQAKESIEKAAYTAVGAPIAAVKAVGARVSDLREAIRTSREDLSEDLAKEFETWVAEGERVVSRALKRLRTTGATDEARAKGQDMAERVQAGIEEMSERMDETLDIIEPEGSLKQIRGIGPSTTARLEEAGVTGIARFLELTETQKGIDDLANKTGFPVETLTGWREQTDLSRVSGIGKSYQELLHRLGIWTTDQLAKAEASILTSEMKTIEFPGTPDQLPGDDEVSDWITKARRIAS